MSEQAPLRIFVVRHGQTEWSLTGQHTGRTDIPLTAQGEDEARTLAPLLRSFNFSHVLSSPLQRARQTSRLAGLGDAAQVLQDLAEWDYGDYEGLRSVEIRERRPGWNIFSDGCPGGESAAQMTARIDGVIAHLRTLSGDVAVFAHGHVGGVLATRWLELPLTEARHFPLATASLSVLALDAKHSNAPIISAWNLTPGRGFLEGLQ
ncbi:histidine phosphatase family protein [Pseudomonas sp. HR96]|uniref:histidine phosphatase family protein n=1 Tax=Pseudomonas sp. HR96 TaxID=1027966 RepID=UPI002A74AD00|nr:histidine phosphatase family protein [Pseudomonas sp. HR96]WPP00941.1 histidine phosphatase family protein [Pseudomonas sp. HR96]